MEVLPALAPDGCKLICVFSRLLLVFQILKRRGWLVFLLNQVTCVSLVRDLLRSDILLMSLRLLFVGRDNLDFPNKLLRKVHAFSLAFVRYAAISRDAV